MNEHDWVVIGIGVTIMVSIIGAVVAMLWSDRSIKSTLGERIATTETKINAIPANIGERVAGIESVITLILNKAVRLMHSPHTPEIDALVEKFQYREGDMTSGDWMRLLQLCSEIEKNTKNPKTERAIAMCVVVGCRKRLGLPMGDFHKHTETTT